MKRTSIMAFVIGSMALMTSCASDDDMEVYMTVDTEYQKTVKEIRERFSYPTQLADEDNYYADLDKFVPTGTAPAYNLQNDLIGEYGYVDLGLSVKWANFNLGAKQPLTDSNLKSFDDIYKEVQHEDVWYEKRFDITLPDTVKDTLPCVISYEEYCKGSYGYIRSQFPDDDEYARYANYCDAMKKAYKKAVKEYNSYIIDNKYSLIVGRYYYNWAEIDSYAWQEDYKNLPMNIAGTEYDNVTNKLGKNWRMPTKAELQELVDKCKWQRYEKANLKGYIVTGPSGKSIFVCDNSQALLNDYPYIYLSSERTSTWNKGVEVYALNINTLKIVNNHPSGRYATIRPVYVK